MKLNVNGGEQELPDAYANERLVWALRDGLGLTGTHYGCGIDSCGSCTVLIDGRATRSCLIETNAARTSVIVTLEGLAASSGATGEELHPVQEAFVEVPLQCMWCLPGHVMTAAALLADNASPTSDEIDAAMDVNLCRCGGYNQIRAATARAAEIGRARR
jgi:aerobic-type carbon monoxide dehydrogenase small subunit (CoxS/CutS family)